MHADTKDNTSDYTVKGMHDDTTDHMIAYTLAYTYDNTNDQTTNNDTREYVSLRWEVDFGWFAGRSRTPSRTSTWGRFRSPKWPDGSSGPRRAQNLPRMDVLEGARKLPTNVRKQSPVTQLD